MPDHRLLIIDDDVRLAEMLAEYLAPEGLELTAVPSGIQGLRSAQRENYDLIILDVMLPGLSGFDVLKQLREAGSKTPVLMLTARGDDVDRIVGLDLGADDYLPKPFNPRELLARVKAILRRTMEPEGDEPAEITVGQLRVNLRRREAWLAEQLAEADERRVRDPRDADALAGRRRVARSADTHGARPAAAARRPQPRHPHQQFAAQARQR